MLTTKQTNYIFLVGSLGLSLGLVPTILAGFPVALESSLPIACFLGIYAATFAANRLLTSAIGMGLQAALWIFIAIWRHG